MTCRLAQVPNVLGMVEETARPVLESKGFKSLVFAYDKSSVVPPYDTYTILSQNPAGGAYGRTCDTVFMNLGE